MKGRTLVSPYQFHISQRDGVGKSSKLRELRSLITKVATAATAFSL